MLKRGLSEFADTSRSSVPRDAVLQLAALCHRETDRGREILLITSSHGRWILPKGWPIDGLDGSEAALQEAWEEAGVKAGKVGKTPIGTYQTVKRYKTGQEVPCQTRVYEVKVKDVVTDFPEADRRERRWVPVDQAAKIVDDDGLRDFLTAI